MKVFDTQWIPATGLMITELSGDIAIPEIEMWEQSLSRELNKIDDGASFKILVNLYGFTAVNVDAHKRFRNIVPLVLSRYNWKVGYVDLFEEEARSIQYTTTRGIQCVAAAHVHQDESKIEKYESNYSRANEHYFTDPAKALDWITNIRVI